MGILFSYSLYSSILLSLLYLSYKWVLAGENQHAYNRTALWLICLVALLGLPLSRLAASIGADAPAAVMPEIEMGQIQIGLEADESAGFQPLWLTAVLWIYLSGVVLTAVQTLLIASRLWRIISAGETVREGRYKIILTDDRSIAPFSWWRYVVMSRSDWNESGRMILTHELQHLSLHHWIDLAVAQIISIFQWYNPSAWLMREEFKTVHEYQADKAVLESGIPARDYQMLLIKKAVGARFPSLANSLNHSKLKKRITMMYKSKSSGEQRLKALALMPALGLALMAAALPQAKAAISTIDNSRMLPDKVTNFSSDVKDCAEKPGFMLQVNGEYSITDSVIKAENPISIVIPKDNPDIKNAPKYYIDGKEVSESELNSIKPEDIERISVFRNPDRTCVTLKEEDSFENSHILTPDGKHNSPEITIMVDGKKISKKELKAIKCENIDSISIDKTKDIIYFTLKKTTEK